MKSNPGGRIDPKEAVGRKRLIDQIWEILEVQSVYMNAERRIGKTTILEILDQEPRAGWNPAKRDLESCHTAEQFAGAVYAQSDQFLKLTGRALRRAKELWAHLGGTEVGGVLTLPEKQTAEWKTLLEGTFQELDEAHRETGKERVLFLWDEVPFMVDNIRKNQGERTAMEVLDTLRFARQTYPSIRMVITGSIGLHHVLTTLKKSGYGNAPINDMAAVDVPPLDAEDAKTLAYRLLEGEQVSCDNREKTSGELAAAADCFPYYIHHLVRQLKFGGAPADGKAIQQIIDQQLSSPNDPWELKHYRQRIGTYYGENETAAVAALDILALSDGALPASAIKERISSVAPVELERLRTLLGLMECDHYLRRTSEGYTFRFPLVRRWWRMDRGLF